MLGRATLGWTAGTALAALVLFGCYLRQSRTVAVGSDGASQALQAWDLLHGNPLLSGWWVTDVSFYTTELPQYALLELARGLHADVIHLAGAMTYTLLVLTAALLARGRADGRAGLARALLTAGIMLAPQLGPATQTLLLAPDHTGTSVPVLLILLLIDWAGPATGAFRWLVPLAVGLGLAWTTLADAMTLFIAVVPLAAVCLLRLARYRRQPAGDPDPRQSADRPGPRQPADGRDRGLTASLAVAAVLAVPAELAASALLRALGGYQVNGLRTALADAGQLAGNARLAGQGVLELFGADVFTASGPLETALAVVHLAGLVLAAAGVLATARRFLRDASLVEQVLLAGIVVDLAAYLAGVQAVDLLSTREIAPVLPFAAVLAGRSLAGRLLARRLLAGRRLAGRRLTARAALTAVLILYAAGLGYAAAQPAAAAQNAGLAGWLRAHHLTAGLSGYHQANIVTLASGGTVTLRAVTEGSGGRLTAYRWNSSAAWYDPARYTATFLVLTVPGQAGASGLTLGHAVATFGRPARQYRYQDYLILVWPPAVNLLARLAPGTR